MDRGWAAQHKDAAGTETQGFALVNQIRMLDLVARGAVKVEQAPDYVVADALARLQTIIE